MRCVALGSRAGSALVLLLVVPAEPIRSQVPTAPDASALGGEVRPAPDDRLGLSIFVPPGMGTPVRLRAQVDSRGGSEAPSGAGGIELRWSGLAHAEALEILRVAREAEEAFSLRILLSPDVELPDLWEFQASLIQAGIRRVQVVSAPPVPGGAGQLPTGSAPPPGGSP
jgi:hypothetical protein